MRLWKLIPINPDNRNWGASIYKGEIIVRAESETKARRLAAGAFGIATNHKPDETVRMAPWDYSGMVAAFLTQETDEYSEDGDASIVYPPEAVAQPTQNTTGTKLARSAVGK